MSRASFAVFLLVLIGAIVGHAAIPEKTSLVHSISSRVDPEARRQAELDADVGRINEQFLGVLGDFERKNKDLVLKDSLRCETTPSAVPAFYQCGFQTTGGAVCKATRHSTSGGKYRPYTVQCLDAKNQRRVLMFRRHV